MAFAFTSVGVNEDRTVNARRGSQGVGWVFHILGQLSHLSSALIPPAGQSPQFAQLYIFDPQLALQQCTLCNSNLREDTMRTLQNVLTCFHRYSRIYQHAFEILSEHEDAGTVEVRLRVMPGQDRRRYNLPTADEVSVILPGDGSASDPRDIILCTRMPDGHQFDRIHEGHPAYAPLHYVLLFPYGEHGWHYGLRLHQPDREEPARLSQSRYVAFCLQVRQHEYLCILRGGKLLQQYMVDMWACIDQSRLSYLRHNQGKLRASLYSGLKDALSGEDEVDLHTLGQRYILPSSYIGGPRHMQQRFQDAMTIARYFRKVDVLLTMTANPQWEEIIRELLPGQTPHDRPDLVARVFSMKLKALLDDLYKHGIFGMTVAYVYVIEFQKRGLPHAHILIIFRAPYKLLTPADVDSLICAEWPNPITQPLLFETIKTCMVHGPCGPLNPFSVCMENGKCTKFYPKSFQSQTRMDVDGYPLYRRRDDGRVYEVGGHLLDNRWIVPYNPYLSARYNCHINVECVASLKSIKYPFKYIHKGSDRATLQYQKDEITQYIEGRYIGPSEAGWRIFHFSLHDQFPNVIRLQVHLPGQHMVTFNPDEDPNVILQCAASERTTLTEFFRANSMEGEAGRIARQLTYQEFPQEMVWHAETKSWSVRKKGFALGWMYFVAPTAGERFYLRTLLTVAKGPRSFDDLRTHEGILYDTFREACIARGLLDDDGEWWACLQEAAEMQTGTRLRHLFVTILLFCNPPQPDQLWTQFCTEICDDLAHQLQTMGHNNPTDDDIHDYGLFLINKLLKESGYTLADFHPMPLPSNNWDLVVHNPLIAEQLSYDRNVESALAATHISELNSEQLDAYNNIMRSLEEGLGLTFFLNGPGGTGKTFVYITLCHAIRSRGWIVLCVASCGIAAILIPGGRTAHSVFKIPIDSLSDQSLCNIPKESFRADLLRATRMIIWDEALMQHRHVPEAVDRSLRDICDDPRPFAGKTVVFGGDFQQTLPVVPKGSQEDIVAASLPRSYIWSYIKVLRLCHNMCLNQATPEEVQFADWLLDVGHGRGVDSDGNIQLPRNMLSSDVNDLVQAVYPSIDGPTPSSQYFLDRIILAARNSDVNDLNTDILNRMQGELQVFHSADTVVKEAGADGVDDSIPVEYLRVLEASGLPPGELLIKLGCPLILLRNLSPSNGLCNGTRVVVVRTSRRVLEVRIMGGDHNGEVVFIPRISLTPTSKGADFAFSLKQFQFPARLAFAISINKAQGQSVQMVGLDLRVPVFSHGQLYVALSRATSCHRIKVLLPDNDLGRSGKTLNVVYPEIFQHEH